MATLPTHTRDHDLSAALLLDSAASFVERGWTQGAASRREDSTPCYSIDEDAAAWCATGAMYAAEFDTGLRKLAGLMTSGAVARAHDVRVRAEEALKAVAQIEFITGWNDRLHQTAANVARTMRTAAEWLRKAVQS